VRVSIVISVYQSYEAVRRQVLHFAHMPLPDDVELFLVDDGSDPPHMLSDYDLPGMSILYTNNKLAWTQGLGRNLGARAATGEYLLFTDIDHILSAEAIAAVRAFDDDRMMFPRYLGVLLADGTLTQELPVLYEYGLNPARMQTQRGLYASVHMNTFAIRHSTFAELGGYPEWACIRGYHPRSRQGDDCHFNARWNRWSAVHGVTLQMGPPIYMFPVGRYHIRGETNPMGLFHTLSYDGVKKAYKDSKPSDGH